jgi:hypothetical protein
MMALPFHSATAQNLVSNPGFEFGTNDWLGLAKISNSPSVTHSGTNALQITVSRSFFVVQALPKIPQQGQDYLLSAWMKSASTSSISMRVRCKDDVYYQLIVGTNKTISQTWTNVSITFGFVSPGTVTNFLIDFANSASTATTFFLDDVSLINISPRMNLVGLSNNEAFFEWPLAAFTNGYVLQSTTNLSVPWTQAGGYFQITNDLYRFRVPSTKQNAFFRLSKP